MQSSMLITTSRLGGDMSAYTYDAADYDFLQEDEEDEETCTTEGIQVSKTQSQF